MNKSFRTAVVMIFTLACATLGAEEFVVKQIVLNGKSQSVSIAAHKDSDMLFLEAPSLAYALGFTLKRQGDLAILCTEAACLPFSIGSKEAKERDGSLFISAPAFFTSVGGEWELSENSSTLTIDLPDEIPVNNAPVDATVGSTAPGFGVIDAGEKEIRLADFLGKKNVVLEFFRSGSW